MSTDFEPVLDARGDTVVLPADFVVTAKFRTFMAGRVPAVNCPHYLPKADADAGFRNCEACASGKAAQFQAFMAGKAATR